MTKYVKFLSNSCYLLILIIESVAHAQKLIPETIRPHGFISQGLIKTDHNRFFGKSDNTSWELTDIGLGGSWRTSPKLQLSAQALYRQAGDLAPGGIQLDYTILNYSVVNTSDLGIGARLGRLKNPYGFFNETRDVASTKPSILLPESIYLDPFRNAFHSSDSVSLHGYKSLGQHLLQADLLIGYPNFDDISEAMLIPSQAGGNLTNTGLSVARTILELDAGRMRIGASYAYTDSKIDPNPHPIPTLTLLPGAIEVTFKLLSFEYNHNQWQFTTEYQLLDLEYKDIAGPNSVSKRTAQSYYYQVKLAANTHLNWILRYDVYYPNRDDKSGTLNPAQGLPTFDAYAKDFTLGMQYQFTNNWMIAAELHQVAGVAWLSSIENPNKNELKEDWNLFSLQVSYKF